MRGKKSHLIYAYNQHGSMISMPHLQSMEWDFMERLRHVARGTTEAYYSYDGSGQRTRKVVETMLGRVRNKSQRWKWIF